MESERILTAVQGLSVGQHRVFCPVCHKDRKRNKNQRELSVRVSYENYQYQCWHCGINGAIDTDQKKNKGEISITKSKNISNEKAKQVMREIRLDQYDHNDQTLNFLVARGISLDVIKENTLGGVYSFQGVKKNAIGFPYRDEESNGTSEVRSIKWRSADQDKMFSQEGSCDQFFNIENLRDEKAMIICEGEIDALTWQTVLRNQKNNYYGVVSVPNGAPIRVNDGDINPVDDKKYQYVWSAREKINKMERIYFSGDTDSQGESLLEELAKRIGRGRCSIIDVKPYKDANELMIKEGEAELIKRLNDSKPYPISNLFRAEDVRHKINDLYREGKPTGYLLHPALSSLNVQIAPSQLTVITGLANAGKSNFVDDACMHLAKTYGMKICYCSFEKPIEQHTIMLMTHLSGKKFFKDGEGERITVEEIDASMEFINDHFIFQDFTIGDRSTSIDEVLSLGSDAVMSGASILVIDPYNWIEPEKNANMSEGISNMLSKCQNWAKTTNSHIIFVAHPRKLMDSSEIPSAQDVAGSFSWSAKADIGITVHRDKVTRDPMVNVWKVRLHWLGKCGTIQLSHDEKTGNFSQANGYLESDWDFAEDL